MIHKRHLSEAAKRNPESVRRFAKWLKLKNTDEMSTRQVIALVNWLLTRREKKMRNLITW